MYRQPVEVAAYNPDWPRQFEDLRTRLWPHVEDLATAIEHVGSTSVEGLAAKPVIDLDIVARDRAAVPEIVARLSALGYVHRGNLGIPDREAFRPPQGSPPHHLYVCPARSAALRNHLLFRDYLRSNRDAMHEY